MGVLYGPEKGVPTDITTVGQFGVPSLGFTAELLAVMPPFLATLGDSWRRATAGPIMFYIPPLSPILQPVRCTVSARLQTAKILKVGSHSIGIPTITLTMTQSTWHTYIWWLSSLSRWANVYCIHYWRILYCISHKSMSSVVVSLGWTLPSSASADHVREVKL